MTADGEEELMRGALFQRHTEPLSDGTSDGQFDGVSEGLGLGDLVVGESVGEAESQNVRTEAGKRGVKSGQPMPSPPTTSASCLMSAAARL